MARVLGGEPLAFEDVAEVAAAALAEDLGAAPVGVDLAAIVVDVLRSSRWVRCLNMDLIEGHQLVASQHRTGRDIAGIHAVLKRPVGSPDRNHESPIIKVGIPQATSTI